mgnify:CR=1 FL=1
MINYLRGDARFPRGSGNKGIAPIVNDKGGWGRSFGLSLSARWSEPEAEYRAWFRGERGMHYLGSVQYVQVEPDIWVANVIGQHDMYPIDGIPPIRYNALRAGLRRVGRFAAEINASIHAPRIGCGLAGGSWEQVESIIDDELNGLEVTVYDLE